MPQITGTLRFPDGVLGVPSTLCIRVAGGWVGDPGGGLRIGERRYAVNADGTLVEPVILPATAQGSRYRARVEGAPMDPVEFELTGDTTFAAIFGSPALPGLTQTLVQLVLGYRDSAAASAAAAASSAADAVAALASKLNASARGAVNGVASLGADGKQLEAEQPDRLSATSLNNAYVPTLPLLPAVSAAAALTKGKTRPVDASAGAVAMTALPSLTSLSVGDTYALSKTDSSGYPVSAAFAAGDTTSTGQTAITLTMPGTVVIQVVTPASGTGKAWRVVEHIRSDTALAGANALRVRKARVAQGGLLRSALAGKESAALRGVTVLPLATTTATPDYSTVVGTVTFDDPSDTVQFTGIRNLVNVGDRLVFTGVTGPTSITSGVVYYVKATFSNNADVITITDTPGGGTRGINAQGTGTLVLKWPINVPAWDRVNGTPNPAIRTYGTRPVQALGTFPRYDYATPDPSIVTYAPGVKTGTGLDQRTVCRKKAIDVQIRVGGTGVLKKVYVDDVLAAQVSDADLTAAGFTSGQTAVLPLRFADDQSRIIRYVEDSSGAEFPGFNVPDDGRPLSYPATVNPGPYGAMVGDSFIEGTGVVNGRGLVRWTNDLLGWNLFKAGSGSTGYYEGSDHARSGSTRPSLVSRYTNDITAQQFAMAWIALGLNDKAWYEFNPQLVLNAATTVWDGSLAAQPDLDLRIIGPWPDHGGTNPSASLVQMDADLHALADARGITYYSPIGDGLRFTTVSANDPHPNDAGHKAIGVWVAGCVSVPALS